MSRTKLALLAAFAAAPIGLAACSSGGHSTAGAPAAPKSTASAPGAPAQTTAAGKPSTGGGGAGGDASAYCKYVSSNTLLQHIGANPDSTDLPSVVQDTQKALDMAPAEIKPYLQSMLKFYKDLAAGKVDVAQADETALEGAVKNYVDWIGQHCAGVIGGATS